MGSTARLPVDARAVGLMVVLCGIWGLQQVALKAAAPDVPPLLMLALRSGISALFVGVLMAVRREPFDVRDGTLGAGMAVGVLFALEFLLVGEGLRHTSASHMVVFLYTAPIFAALGLHWLLPAERLHRLQWLGIGLAFAGVAWAFLGEASPAGGASTAWGDLLGVLAAIAWGATTVLVRSSALGRASATKTLLYQLVGAFVLLMAAAALSGQMTFRPTPLALGVLAFQGIVVSFASFLAWFWLLRVYAASQLGVFTFMTPLFGVALAHGLLDEPLEPSFQVGATLVLAGIALVSGVRPVTPSR